MWPPGEPHAVDAVPRIVPDKKCVSVLSLHVGVRSRSTPVRHYSNVPGWSLVKVLTIKCLVDLWFRPVHSATHLEQVHVVTL